MKLLLVGATGLVGSNVLRLALADARVGSVVAPSRQPLLLHPKLQAPVVNFDDLPQEAEWWQADAVICTLGTTLSKAGSRQAFQRVDHGYPLEVGRLAALHGARTYVLNSALGADVSSRFFYNRVKGELERDLEKIGFASLTFVRPGLIVGDRPDVRRGETAAASILTLLGPVLPRRWHVNPAHKIAEALLEAAIDPMAGIHVVSSERMA